MRLAVIPFANTVPFFHNLDPAWLGRQTLLYDAPRDLGDLARADQVDAGVFSLVDVWDLESRGLFEPLGGLCIAGNGPIASILLFGVEDPAGLEGAEIAVTGQSATTVRLLEAWLRLKVGLRRFRFVPLGSPARATLLIGDQALARGLALSSQEPAPIDLSREWTSWTGKSFVFARWAVRKSLASAEKEELRGILEQSLERSLSAAGILELCRAHGAQSGFPPDFLRSYLSGIIFKLGPKELEGMALFKAKLKEINETTLEE